MRIPALTLLMLLSACGQSPSGGGNIVTSPNQVAAKPSAAPSSPRPPAPRPLIDYVGEYAFAKIGGRTFLDRPEVKAAVGASGASAEVRRWILEGAGPQTPIALRTGRLISWGCEAHNCGPHNWTILITKDGGDAEICYHDDSIEPATNWYADGKRESRTDECPSGDEK